MSQNTTSIFSLYDQSFFDIESETQPYEEDIPDFVVNNNNNNNNDNNDNNMCNINKIVYFLLFSSISFIIYDHYQIINSYFTNLF